MWVCKKCREQIEDSFDVCWSCGTTREGVEDPSFRSADEARAEVAEVDPGVEPSASPSVSPQQARLSQPQSACAKCGARQVIPAVRVLDRDGEYTDKSLSVRLDRNPEAWIFKGSEVVELKATVCARCGYVELYATNPGALWSAYKEQAEA